MLPGCTKMSPHDQQVQNGCRLREGIEQEDGANTMCGRYQQPATQLSPTIHHPEQQQSKTLQSSGPLSVGPPQ